MLRYSASSRAAPEAVWPLLAEPAQWHRWAPHIRGARGLGEPEVRAGCAGAVLIGPWVPVPARITAKHDGGWWEWRVGGVEMRHAVSPAPGGGCTVEITVNAPARVLVGVRAGYGPLITPLIRNLARVAVRSTPRPARRSPRAGSPRTGSA